MAQINQLELQNIRHLIGQHETAYKKLSTYAQQCTDPQLKQFFSAIGTGSSDQQAEINDIFKLKE